MKGTYLKVRGYHCDAYSHVNNARYLEFLEEARWNFLEPALKEKFFEERNLIFVVVNINIAYKKPLIPNQEIMLGLSSIEYKNKSIIVHQTITDKDTAVLCSSAEVSFVLINTRDGRPATVSQEIIDKFNQLIALYNV